MATVVPSEGTPKRVPVNPISGQVGVAAGAGAVGATVQRTTLASDDPLVVSTGAIADAAATAGSTGSVQAKLRLLTSQLGAVKTAVELLDNMISGSTALIQGNIASGVAQSGNPVGIGGRAVVHGSAPSTVDADDRTDFIANRAGLPFMMGGSPDVQCPEWKFTSAQTDVKIITVSSGTKIVVTKISVMVSKTSTSTSTAVRVGFGASTLPTVTSNSATPAAGIVFDHGGIVPGSGATEGTGAGIIGVGADGEDLIITCGAATTGGVTVRITYYTIPS